MQSLAKTNSPILYHEPDNRWPIFNCPDYDTYLERYLVKGLFHSKVPEAIIKEFETIEHLMAHAWYHYPMYDEAMNKLLRTVELAVKKKCEELSIPVNFINNKGKQTNKRLVDLIQEIGKREPEKRLNVFLNHLRDLRNLVMHPNDHSYMGGMHYNKIVFTVNILNILFGDENYFVDLRQRAEKMSQLLSAFSQKVLGLSNGGKNFLHHNIVFGDVFVNGDEVIVLLFLDPVVKLTTKAIEEKMFPVSNVLRLKNFKIQNGIISGVDLGTGMDITVSEVTNELLVKTGTDFRNYLLGLEALGHNPYLTNRLHEQSKEIQYFRYRYYHLIKKAA